MTFESIEQVQKANREAGYHFFDPDTMRFFNSRIESTLFRGQFFVTSEQGPNGIRAYTVREALDSGSVKTVGEFQEYGTKRKAMQAILEAVREIEATHGGEYDG